MKNRSGASIITTVEGVVREVFYIYLVEPNILQSKLRTISGTHFYGDPFLLMATSWRNLLLTQSG
jgi:hypothetical protein